MRVIWLLGPGIVVRILACASDRFPVAVLHCLAEPLEGYVSVRHVQYVFEALL